MSSELRASLEWSGWSLWLLAVIGLVFDLFHVDRVLELVTFGLAICGALFAVRAMIDAHRSFRKAEDVERAVGSFRMSFRNVLMEMIEMVNNASGELHILIPTPAYGYLYDQVVLSENLVQAIEKFLGRDGVVLHLFLMLGDTFGPGRNLIPQKYLKRADNLGRSGRGRPEVYIQLLNRVFDAAAAAGDRAELKVLPDDRNIRMVVADPDDGVRQACLLSFAQSEVDEELASKREFQSKGFRSTRAEMVEAVHDLLKVYTECAKSVSITDLRDYYTCRI